MSRQSIRLSVFRNVPIYWTMYEKFVRGLTTPETKICRMSLLSKSKIRGIGMFVRAFSHDLNNVTRRVLLIIPRVGKWIRTGLTQTHRFFIFILYLILVRFFFVGHESLIPIGIKKNV